MRLLDLAAAHYECGAPNAKPAEYWQEYERRFAARRLDRLSILEVGVAQGASARIWREYMPNARIVCIDMNAPPPRFPSDGETFFVKGLQDSADVLAKAASLSIDGVFDIVIDDCSHVGFSTIRTFRQVFPRFLRCPGTYVIEDYGAPTLAGWSDGAPLELPGDVAQRTARFPSYDYGTVGVVKQLIDHLVSGHADRLAIAEITLFSNIAFIMKREPRRT